MSKELIKHIGESTAYSAKGHFKTADIRRISTYRDYPLNCVNEDLLLHFINHFPGQR
jgi:hypothetical protein